MSAPSSERIASITLDEKSLRHLRAEVEHERTIAVTDLLHNNSFTLTALNAGPYDLHLSVREQRLVMDVKAASHGKPVKFTCALQPLRGLIRDYFLICDSYYEAIKTSNTSRLEAIDMGRRGLHNEAAELLQSLLEDDVRMDFNTSRRLFTLICVLHIK